MNNMIRKSVEFKSTLLKDEGDYFQFEGYASTFGNLDRGRDVVVQGAFKDSLKDSKPVMLYQHDPRQVIGIYEDAKEDDKGLYVKGMMPKSHSLAKDVYALLKCGAIKSMSIGFTIDESEWKEEENIRFLKRVTLWEVSLVTFPMNPAADVTVVKSMNGLSSIREVERYLKSNYKISQKESRALIAKIKSFTDQCDAGQESQPQCDAESKNADTQCDAGVIGDSQNLISINKKLDDIITKIKTGA